MYTEVTALRLCSVTPQKNFNYSRYASILEDTAAFEEILLPPDCPPPLVVISKELPCLLFL